MYIKIYLYLSLLFFKSLAVIYAIFISLIFLMQLPGNLKGTSAEKTVLDVITETLLQMPQLAIETAPFILLFASFYCFKTLNNNKEIVIFKSVGISVWQILTPFLINTLIFYLIIIFIFNYLNINSIKYLANKKSSQKTDEQIISIYNKDIWIVDKTGINSQTIVLTNKLGKKNNNLVLGKSVIFQIENNQLVRLINTQTGFIKNNQLYLENVTFKDSSNPIPINADSLVIDFRIKLNKFNDFNLVPEQTYIWNLFSIIKYLEQTSLNSLEFKVYLYNQITLPLFFFTLIFISAYFAMSTHRVQNVLVQTILTLVTGFTLYFSFNFASSLSYTGFIPPIIAIIGLKSLLLLVSFNLLLFKEGV